MRPSTLANVRGGVVLVEMGREAFVGEVTLSELQTQIEMLLDSWRRLQESDALIARIKDRAGGLLSVWLTAVVGGQAAVAV